MNLLAATLYDPAGAVTKSTASALAMTAFDTTNLRLRFTVPPSGRVRVRMQTNLSGATTMPQVLLGVLDGSTVKGRQVALGALPGTAVATTNVPLVADFIVSGLTPGTDTNYDAAYGVETTVGSTNIHYGGPNNTSTNDAWGGFAFEIWDPSPIYAPAANGVPPTTSLADTNGRVDVAKAAGTAWNSGAIGASTLASDTIAAAKIATGAITSAKFAAGAIDAAAIADGAIDAGSIAADAITAAKIANGAIDAATFAADVDAEILSYLVDDATRIDASALNTLSGHDPGETIMGATDLGTGAGLTSLASAVNLATVDTVVDAIKVTTDKLDDTVEDDAGTFRFTANALEQAPTGGSAPTAADIADAVWDEVQSGHTSAGTFGRYLDAQVANVETDTQDIQSRLPAALVSGRIDASVGAMASGVLTATAIAADAITDAKVAADVTIASVTGAVGSVTGNVGGNVTGSIGSLATQAKADVNAEVDTALADAGVTTTVTGRIDAAVSSRLATASYTAPLDAAGTRAAMGLGAANLDTQLSAIAGYIDTEVAAIITAIAALNNISTADVLAQVEAALTATVSDSVPADGTRPSISSGIYMLTQFLLERSVSGTTCTVKKPDGTTSLFTLTLDDATAPTSITRAT